MFVNTYGKARSNAFLRFLFRSPARISIFAFMILIAIGTILLMMPVSSKTDPISFIDALFTATSASCVTGLTVTNTGSSFSFFGQMVILFLIQTGGLGIMTLSTLFILVAGRRLSLAGKIVIQDTFTYNKEQSVYTIVKEVLLFAFFLEGLGTIILFSQFFPEQKGFEAFYYSVFHSISAFCNAGFSLFSDNFIRYRNNWVVNLVICFLIILGGIGFIVISEMKRHFFSKKWSWMRISFHSKITLSTTFVLLVFGTLLFLMMEWRGTLNSIPLPEKMLASFFHAVSARTAGFNTLPVGNLANETLFFLIILMFIGTSPGSCGGGIKTTTAAVLSILGVSRMRGLQHPRIFRRTIPESCIAKAMSIVLMSMLVIVIATMALLTSELGPASHFDTRGKFLELFFEVISAFGTVGLSTGITEGLSLTGKLIITLVMFIGRLGPLVLALAISREKVSRVRYAEENVMIG